MLNQLNVSGVDIEDPTQLPVSTPVEAQSHYNMQYSSNEGVNDELIEDIQKRLELLDEFK